MAKAKKVPTSEIPTKELPESRSDSIGTVGTPTKSVGKDISEVDVKSEEIEALKSDEIDEIESDQESPNSQEISLKDDERVTETEQEIAPEVAAINEDNKTAKDASQRDKKKTSKAKRSKQSKKTGQKKTKSKQYQKTVEDFDKKREFSVEEAIEQVKRLSYSKFDGTITLDVKISKAKRGEENVRGTIKLPHPTGKTQNVVVATDELIERIKKGETNFDLLLATPEMMPKLGQVAKILGPKGKMPNPKDGTVVEDTAIAMENIESTVRYRMDAGRNLHICVGKVSTESAKLSENIRAALKALTHLKKDSATLSPTMGPGVKIAL